MLLRAPPPQWLSAASLWTTVTYILQVYALISHGAGVCILVPLLAALRPKLSAQAGWLFVAVWLSEWPSAAGHEVKVSVVGSMRSQEECKQAQKKKKFADVSAYGKEPRAVEIIGSAL